MSRRAAPMLVVTFHKVSNGRSPCAWWEAVRPTGGRITGGFMPIGRGRIPHDLGHMATEASLKIDNGFWGLLARGATFAHGTRQRPTRPGRQLIREHRAALAATEALGNHHHATWAAGGSTPVAPTFERLARMWDATPDDGTLTVRWPTLESDDDCPTPPSPLIPPRRPTTPTNRSIADRRYYPITPAQSAADLRGVADELDWLHHATDEITSQLD